MKRRTFVRNLATSLAVPATVTGSSFTKHLIRQETTEWNMVTQFRVNQKHQDFARSIAEASKGQLLIKLNSRGTEPPAKVINDVSKGNIEMGWGNLLYSPLEEEGGTRVHNVPAANFLIMPFGLTAQEYNVWLEYGGGRQLVDKIYEKIGCKYFPAGNTGIQMGGWFAKEINTVNDLKGLKIRISGFGAAALKALGAEPYDLAPWSDDAQHARMSGKLDAFELGNPSSDLASGLHKQYKYYYYPAWHEPSVPFDLFINRVKWDSLPSNLKSIVSTAAKWLNYQWLNERMASAATALETLVKEHDVKIRRFPEPVLAELARAAERIMREKAAQDMLSQDVYDSIILFRKKASSWGMVSLQPFLSARGNL